MPEMSSFSCILYSCYTVDMKLPLLKRRTNQSGTFIHKRYWYFLLVGILALFALLYIFFSVSPATEFTISTIKIPVLYLFLVLIGITLFSLSTFFLASKKHGILISIFVLLYLWMRMNNLLHPLFTILLVGLFLTLELLFSAKKE